MPRTIWSGAISFGLVNAPVRMYSAIAEHKLHFQWIHERDESPIGYQKICKLEDKPLPDDEVVKAFELEPGEYVFMEDEDFEAAPVEGYKTIEITDFVPDEQIDPTPPDLIEALRASIAAAGRGSASRRRSRRSGSNGDLTGFSKSELEERARKANIPGRSKMSKDELIEALSEAA